MTLYTGILSLAKLKYIMSKDLSTKTLSSFFTANTQEDIKSLKQEILSAKIKLHRPIQDLYQKMNF